jgi:hypothetical protein
LLTKLETEQNLCFPHITQCFLPSAAALLASGEEVRDFAR